MTITASTIAFVSTAIALIASIIGFILKIHSWCLHQEEQDKRIDENTKEQGIICECLLGVLDGLEQLGCNHTVTEKKEKMQGHLNERAHK